MNFKRKIQIAALAVIVNGGAALGLMAPGVALADTCTSASGTKCDIYGLCAYGANSICTGYAPAGCKVVQAICYPAGSCWYNGLPQHQFYCQYQAK